MRKNTTHGIMLIIFDQKYCILGLLTLFGLSPKFSFAQEPLRFTTQKIDWKSEWTLSTGLAWPLGAWAARALQSNTGKGNAGLGGAVELKWAQRIKHKPLWAIQALGGYAHHAFRQPPSNANLLRFEAQPWQLGHAMFGAQFELGRRFKLQANAALGLVFYRGWNAQLEQLLSPNEQEILHWRFGIRAALGLRLGLQTTLRLAPQQYLVLEALYLRANGQRAGQLTRQYYQNGLLMEESQSLVLHPSPISSLRLQIGYRQHLYRFLRLPRERLQGIRY
jgi:hypothetical protein